ncbi:hypothetical protein [Vibrio sp. CyArs1]|uniref:hypothetical protein n=1 Tax=Vibrio sp. CyArs1 TaxID=2682577 RepID=UPI001F059274|nr:hypothetical protein [Vibrio sp. CyArs1]
MSIEMFILGQPYPNKIPVHEGAVAEFLRPNYNRLFVALPQMTHSETEAINNGSVSVKLLADQHTNGMLLVFSFRTEGCQLNFDCPFDASILPDINLESVMDAKKRLALQIVAVDSATKTVTSLRFITMSVELTFEFLNIVHRQLSLDFSSSAANRWVDSQRMMYSPDDMSLMPVMEHVLGES